jgi:hypothetical protein
MSDFDLAVGIDGATMTQAGAVVYRQLYPKLFTGSQSIEKEGLLFQVSWDVQAPPTFVLSAPANGEALLRAHLLHLPPLPGVSRRQVVEGLLGALAENVFQLELPNVLMTLKADGYEGTARVQVSVVAQAQVEQGKMSLRAIKAIGKTDNPSDEWFVNHVILPQAMHIGGTLLDGITLPPLSFANVSLTPPTLIVRQNHIIALANLSGRPVPQPPFADAWPTDPFFAVLSSEAKLQIARMATASLAGKELHKGDSISIGIGDVHYNATARLGALSIGDAGGTAIGFNDAVQGNVNAGIKIGCTNIGLNYNLLAKPDPNGRIGLSVSGTTVRATTAELATFVLVLIPYGDPLEWVLSAVTYPLTQAVVAAFSPLITQLFQGISFDVYELPSIPINVDAVHLTVQPSQVRFGDWGGRLAIMGQAVFG